MADIEKDRFGDKLRDEEKGREDEYFARRDRELIEKLRQEQSSDSSGAPQDRRRWTVPRCGTKLVEQVAARHHGGRMPELRRPLARQGRVRAHRRPRAGRLVRPLSARAELGGGES